MSGSKSRGRDKSDSPRLAQEVLEALTRYDERVVSNKHQKQRAADQVARALAQLHVSDDQWLADDEISPLFLELEPGTYIVERADDQVMVRQIGWTVDHEAASLLSEDEALVLSINLEAQDLLRYLKRHAGQEAQWTAIWWLQEGARGLEALGTRFQKAIEQERADKTAVLSSTIANQQDGMAAVFREIEWITREWYRKRLQQRGRDWFDRETYTALAEAVERLGNVAHILLEMMKEWRLFATDASAMMAGLAARVRGVEESDDYADLSYVPRMREVYEAFRPYNEGKDLPPGTTAQVMRFLVVSAGVSGLWRKMDEDNRLLGDCLLGYYGEGLSTVELVDRIPGVTNPGSAGQYLERGIRWLWNHLPEASAGFPIDKHTEFPLDELQATRKERRRAASKKWAKEHHFNERGKEFAMRRWGAKSDSVRRRDNLN